MRRIAASALIASWLVACQTYRPVPTTALDSGSPREYGRLLVVTRDGYELELVHAYIRADSIVGFEKGKAAGLLEHREPPRRLAFARDQVVRVESSKWVMVEPAPQASASRSKARGDDDETARRMMCLFTFFTLCPASPTALPSPGPAQPKVPPKDTPTAH